jgi:uncharacterized damage-inducible protein DinB
MCRHDYQVLRLGSLKFSGIEREGVQKTNTEIFQNGMGEIGMLTLFRYNWQVRDEWFDWCTEVATEELVRQRTGGACSILRTLWHVVDAEYSYVRLLQGRPDIEMEYNQYDALPEIQALSNQLSIEVRPFIESLSSEMEAMSVQVPWWNGETFTCGEILRHVIAHEIHHVGQLSVWARELDRKPVSANLIGRHLT